MFKKILSVLLAVILLAGTAVTAFAAGSKISVDSAEAKKKLEEACVEAWNSNTETVNVERFKISFAGKNTEDDNKLSDVLYEIMCKHPECFWVKTNYGWYNTGNQILLKLEFNYFYKGSEKETKIREVKSAVDKIVAKASTFDTELEKVLYVNDILESTTAYDNETAKNKSDKYGGKRTAWDCLCGHLTVCQGFGQAFSYIMKELGIECYTVQSNDANHIWNVVKIGNDYYHIDTTWNTDNKDNFLISSDTRKTNIKNNGYAVAGTPDWRYNGFKGRITLNNTKFESSFFTKAKNEMLRMGNNWYYTDGNSIYRKSDLSDLNGGNELYTSNNTITDIAVFGGEIYFSTADEVFCLSLTAGQTAEIYTAESVKKLSADELVDADGIIDLKVMGSEANPTTVSGAEGKCLAYCIGKSFKRRNRDFGSYYLIRETEIIACNHNWKKTTVRATCGTAGYEYEECLLCGEASFTSTNPTGEHDVKNAEWIVTTPATCTAAGVETQYCNVCGKAADTRFIPAAGEHQEGKAATCKKQAVCSVCGQSYGDLGSHVDNGMGRCKTCGTKLSGSSTSDSGNTQQGTSSQESGFFQAILNFFKNLFGRK